MNAFDARRRFLGGSAALALAAVPLVSRARPVRPAGERCLGLVHTHTGERLDIAYAQGDAYRADALRVLNHFLRDHYSGEAGVMDPGLFDQLHRLQASLGCSGPYEVISAFRCERTNERLRLAGGGGVAKRSLHMDGRAMDVRLPGVPLAELRDAALALRAGGVGYYAREQFVHVDTGPVRRW